MIARRRALIRRVKSPERLLGDKAYEAPIARGVGLPRDKAGHSKPFQQEAAIQLQQTPYKLRWPIESAFNRLKDFRRIATRDEKLPETVSPQSALQPPSYGGFNELDPSVVYRKGLAAWLARGRPFQTSPPAFALVPGSFLAKSRHACPRDKIARTGPVFICIRHWHPPQNTRGAYPKGSERP